VPLPPAVVWHPAVRADAVHAATIVTSRSIRRLSSATTTTSGRLPSTNRPSGYTAWSSPAALCMSTRSGVAVPASDRGGWVHSDVSSAAHSLRLERYEVGATDAAVVMSTPVGLRLTDSVTSSQTATNTGTRR
jgi:hypothetical protein